MTIAATLRLPDGRLFTVTSTSTMSHSEYDIWNEWDHGNYGCDCNRQLFLNEQHHLDLDVQCGETIRLVSLHVDGIPVEL